jgi:hypothetical protein
MTTNGQTRKTTSLPVGVAPAGYVLAAARP